MKTAKTYCDCCDKYFDPTNKKLKSYKLDIFQSHNTYMLSWQFICENCYAKIIKAIHNLKPNYTNKSCKVCKGKGTLSWNELLPEHKNIANTENIQFPCSNCRSLTLKEKDKSNV